MLDKVSGIAFIKIQPGLHAALQRGIELAKEYKGPLKIKKIILEVMENLWMLWLKQVMINIRIISNILTLQD